MEERCTDWLREHMRDHIADYDAHSGDNVLTFKRPPNSPTSPGEVALALIHQVAERITEANNYAAEREAHAENLALKAIEQLKGAYDRIQVAESGRLVAETALKKLGDRVRETEKVVEKSASRISAIEAQLSAAEQRARTAEMRATEAENALKCIEEALRVKILSSFGNSGRIATAA